MYSRSIFHVCNREIPLLRHQREVLSEKNPDSFPERLFCFRTYETRRRNALHLGQRVQNEFSFPKPICEFLVVSLIQVCILEHVFCQLEIGRRKHTRKHVTIKLSILRCSSLALFFFAVHPLQVILCVCIRSGDLS